jgi:hypothetical protein
MKKSLLHNALTFAKNKFVYHGEFNNFIHFSFIVQSNKIIEIGKNNKKIPKLHFGYHRRLQNDPFFHPKTHSELHVWMKSKGILNKNKSFEMINIRLNKKGFVRLSKPCTCCYNLLKELGCKAVYYSSEIGFLKISLF